MSDGQVVVLIFMIVFFLIFGILFFGLEWYKFFAPKYAEVRREIFENTKSYNEGKEQDLVRYRLEYLRANTDEEKEAIASTIRFMFADYDSSKLDEELQNFLKSIMKGEF